MDFFFNPQIFLLRWPCLRLTDWHSREEAWADHNKNSDRSVAVLVTETRPTEEHIERFMVYAQTLSDNPSNRFITYDEKGISTMETWRLIAIIGVSILITQLLLFAVVGVGSDYKDKLTKGRMILLEIANRRSVLIVVTITVLLIVLTSLGQ